MDSSSRNFTKRAAVDSRSLRAVGGGAKTGKNPVDRGKKGSKHHLLVDGNGTPLAAIVTGANVHDVTQFEPLVNAVPLVCGKPGRPRRRTKELCADRAYDSQPHRERLRKRCIKPKIARHNTEHGSGLGKRRWPVERTHSWYSRNCRLRVRTDRRDDIHEAWLAIASALICFNVLVASLC